jgi:hypothetical protein
MTTLNDTHSAAGTADLAEVESPKTRRKGVAAVQTSTQLSVITATTPARLAKRFELVDGKLVKHPGGELVRGNYRRVEVHGAQGLADLVASLNTNQALTFGVASVVEAPIASRKQAQAGDITRTRDHFDWPCGSGVMFIDYDPQPGVAPMSPDRFLSELEAVWPALAQAPAVQGSSGSAFIYDKASGVELKGAGGLRLWVLVADARDVPRAGSALADRLWMAGNGRYQVSESGALLPRTLIDDAVFQPERLDFASGASCGGGLMQRRPPLSVRNPTSMPVDTLATLPDLTADERRQLIDVQTSAKLDVGHEQAKARERWTDARMAAWESELGPKLAAMPAPEAEEARTSQRTRLERAVTERRLFGDFELRHSSGRTLTVGELLDDPKRWHNERFADPLEPEYARDSRIAWANLRSGGKPYIWSHAHGGQRFNLERAAATITVNRGEGPRIVNEADELLRLNGEVYQRGGMLVRIADCGILPVTGPWLRNNLESICRFEAFDGRKKKSTPTDCPSELHTRLLHNRGAWGVPELTGIVRAPIMRIDGTLLTAPGYDDQTELLLLADNTDGWPRISPRPTSNQVRAAVRSLWEPFEHFPFRTPVDRGVHLAACLTAVQRQVLETAPAFAWNAHRAGTGKSKAAKAVGWLGGAAVPESPWSTEAEEQRKRLMASLLAGPAALLLDNINGPLESDTLCSILTSSQFSDRRLGVSEDVTVPTRVLMLATGNNIRIVGDLARRVLTVTIDHGIESPGALSFPFCPVARMRERWQHYRAAALTILRGFVAAGMPAGGSGTMGSFEVWDRMVRQCVVWLRDQGLTHFELDDPFISVKRNQDEDPEMVKLRALLAVVDSQGTTSGVTVPELTRVMSTADYDVLDEIAGERGVINKRRLGRWLERHQGQVVTLDDGRALKLMRVGTRQGYAIWKACRVA